MTNHHEIREQAQRNAHNLASAAMPVAEQDTHSREEAEATLGLSWSNISTIYPHDTANLSQLHSAIERLRDEGYVVSVETDENRVVMQVSISHEVFTRFHRSNEE